MHVNPGLIHVNVWQKPLQYYKVINLQLIKINGKKKRVLIPGRNNSEENQAQGQLLNRREGPQLPLKGV